MEKLTKSCAYERSSILYLPILNALPGEYDTIYTVLLEAIERAKESGQDSCIVTFDQPLYWKAKDIILSSEETSPLKNIILRLGGFHLAMSFLGINKSNSDPQPLSHDS